MRRRTVRNEDLELVEWLIDRSDGLRESVANRAAIVLSADALLFTGVIFLLNVVFSGGSHYSKAERLFIYLCIVITTILLSFSIFNAITGVVNVWKKSREMFGVDMPQRLFFHARDTIEAFKSFAPFKESFLASNEEQMMDYALGALWTSLSTFHYRYRILRRAIRLLLLSLMPFLVSIAVVLFAG
jgi:hypothetical protein